MYQETWYICKGRLNAASIGLKDKGKGAQNENLSELKRELSEVTPFPESYKAVEARFKAK